MVYNGIHPFGSATRCKAGAVYINKGGASGISDLAGSCNGGVLESSMSWSESLVK